MVKERANSLDALRGYAIVTMVLASAIFATDLPAWMSHVQTPPPTHEFRPDIAGISWVDLVFPFFLFSMGAAMPFSVGRKLEKGQRKWWLALTAVWRGVKLAFFAVFLMHMYPPMHATWADPASWAIPILAFVALFMLFGKWPRPLPKMAEVGIEVGGLAIAIVLLVIVGNAYDRPFSLDRSNIIILVLANMSIFGTLIYIFTHHKPIWVRLAILPFVLAILYFHDDGWQKAVFTFSPVEALYKFAFLKYLCIVIPGTVAGTLLKESLNRPWQKRLPPLHTASLLCIAVALIVLNLWGLYTRHLAVNFITSAALMAAAFTTARHTKVDFLIKIIAFGSFMLLLGLFLEPAEGGIKKDPSTVSYYFVTSGLACFALLAFSMLCDVLRSRKLTAPLVMAGKNPMIAYVTTALLVNPVMQLTGFYDWLDCMHANAWLAFLRGVIVTSFTVMVTMAFTHIKWYWRT